MNRSVRLLGHPVHQMLVVLPAGLLLTVYLVDLWYLVDPRPELADLSHPLLPLGLAAGALAAPFGFVDWRRIPDPSRARRVGAVHGMGNALALLLFLVSWLTRSASETPLWPALLASLAAGTLMLLTAWLGGELVSRLGVGVYEDAHVNAPSSLLASRQEAATGTPHTPAHAPSPSTPGPEARAAMANSRRGAPVADSADLSVAGEEDPGAAIDTTDMAPTGGRRPR